MSASAQWKEYSLTGLLALLSDFAWMYRYSAPYAVGTGVVLALFIGKSAEFHGKYALAMKVVEVGVLVSSVALLVVFFLPAVRSHFRALQANKTMEPTR